jgi:3-hydroxybutyryl-CoA dehydratase
LAVSAGAELDLGVWTVTEEKVRQYLSAVGDQQPAYFDLALAPPLALSAWSLGSLLKQLALPPGAIHSLQDMETFRGVSFGEELHATAQVAKLRQRGNMKFISVVYALTDRSGQQVHGGKTTVLVVDSTSSDSGGTKSPQPPFTKGDETGVSGDSSGSMTVVSRTISQERLNAYAEASGDDNPLHLDAAFAAKTPFGGIIAHGMLTLAFIGEMMTAELGRSWLETGSIKARFKGAAYLGDDVVTWGRAVNKGAGIESPPLEYTVGVGNQASGQELITGNATIKTA